MVHSNSPHLQLIYTGFFMLYKKGIVDMKQKILKDIVTKPRVNGYRNAKLSHLRVILNNHINIHYDMLDGLQVDQNYLNKADFYFKRSYSPTCIENLGEQRAKIFPLGLNYLVYPKSFDRFQLQRGFYLERGIRNKISAFYRAMNLFLKIKFTPNLNSMQSVPDHNLPPKILFIAKAWSPQEALDRRLMQINETRKNCIKVLREVFGNNFYGGFIHTEFALKNYKKYLLPDNNVTSKKNYIKLLRSFPIGIATTGLHGSIGSKFAEYIAFSKAILSEKLNCEVPGELKNGENYLEFSSPEECVYKANQLVNDRQFRNQMMTNNARYFLSYLRPDLLVLNTIQKALSSK
jgi:hypothetical protein